jgi:uncharacterized protein (DUF1330 family)
VAEKPALWISHVSVKDEEALGKYAALAGTAMAKQGGQFLARGGGCVQLEGIGRPRNVVVQFKSLEAAEACYHSPDYQAALIYTQDASERDLLVIETT